MLITLSSAQPNIHSIQMSSFENQLEIWYSNEMWNKLSGKTTGFVVIHEITRKRLEIEIHNHNESEKKNRNP